MFKYPLPGSPGGLLSLFPEIAGNLPQKTPIDLEFDEQNKLLLGKSFSFIYGLPHSSKVALFSFSSPVIALFNFSLSPVLLLGKIGIIVMQLGLLLAFVMLELGIAFLQAYVFIILTTIYINDSLQLH